jgi:hypothetical protein
MSARGQIPSLERCRLHDRSSPESGSPSAALLCRNRANRPGSGPSLNSLLPLFGQGAGVPYGCGIEEEAAVGEILPEATQLSYLERRADKCGTCELVRRAGLYRGY